jgi:muramoyltetrapeptide carboxypeptidase
MTQIIVPEPLKDGDTIGIAAPAATFNLDKLYQGISVLKEMGFRVEIPKAIFERKRYLAGNDKQRAQTFENLLKRDEISAIICARGGFGSLRMLPYFHKPETRPKRIIGFSDITPILNLFAFKYGWITFHGPVITMLADADNQTIESLYKALTEYFPSQMPNSGNIQVLSKGTHQIVLGRLWGGNLTTLCHTTGTSYSIDCQEGILFLEDRGEAPFRIDRMLTQMRLSGCFNCVKGVLLGSFRDCGDLDIIHEVILECFGDKIPVYANYECGHDLPNYTIPVGPWVQLTNGIVTFLNEEYPIIETH